MPVGVQQVVTVWGKSYELMAVQKSKSVWTATGDYLEHDRIRLTSTAINMLVKTKS
jgi:hypothetical protein